MSLLNQFSGAEAREIMKYVALTKRIRRPPFLTMFFSSKLLLPLVCYVFQDGPWRDTLVKFGYDPRTNPAAYSYVIIRPVVYISFVSRVLDINVFIFVMQITRLRGRLLLRDVRNGRPSWQGRVPSNMVLTVNTKGGKMKLWVRGIWLC